jgi:hypothetical protein
VPSACRRSSARLRPAVATTSCRAAVRNASRARRRRAARHAESGLPGRPGSRDRRAGPGVAAGRLAIRPSWRSTTTTERLRARARGGGEADHARADHQDVASGLPQSGNGSPNALIALARRAASIAPTACRAPRRRQPIMSRRRAREASRARSEQARAIGVAAASDPPRGADGRHVDARSPSKIVDPCAARHDDASALREFASATPRSSVTDPRSQRI